LTLRQARRALVRRTRDQLPRILRVPPAHVPEDRPHLFERLIELDLGAKKRVQDRDELMLVAHAASPSWSMTKASQPVYWAISTSFAFAWPCPANAKDVEI